MSAALCTFDGCDRRQHAKSLCKFHYARLKAAVALDAPKKAAPGARGPCSVVGCGLVSQARGYCPRHYQRWTNGKDVNAPFRTDPRSCASCGVGLSDRTTRVRCPSCAKKHTQERFKSKGFARKSKFGIEPEEFARRLAEQGGRCAICRGDDPRGLGWHLDHDHAKDAKDKSGHRGILCTPCNMGLGCFRDDEVTLERAIAYLRRHTLGIRVILCA